MDSLSAFGRLGLRSSIAAFGMFGFERYSLQREAFGAPISKLYAIQEKLAEMDMRFLSFWSNSFCLHLLAQGARGSDDREQMERDCGTTGVLSRLYQSIKHPIVRRRMIHVRKSFNQCVVSIIRCLFLF